MNLAEPSENEKRPPAAWGHFRAWWPALAALGLLLASCGWLWLRAGRDTGGHAPYVLDDSYITMAMAKHAAAGVWGVTPYEFSSTTSTPLWVALTAILYRLAGPGESALLLQNILAAMALLLALHWLLRREGVRPLPEFLVLLLAIFAVPLPPIAFCGLEHPLHMLLVIGLVYSGAQALTPAPRRGTLVVCCTLAALAVLTRYESAFLVGALMWLALLRRKFSAALWLGCAAALPLLGYGLWCAGHGWPIVPTSILMKAARPEFSFIGLLRFIVGDTPKGAVGLLGILTTPHMLALGLLLLTALLALRTRPPAPHTALTRDMLVVALLGTLLHMQLAQVGWFYRYENYLLLLGLVTVTLALRHGAAVLTGWQRRAWPLLILLALVPLGHRSWHAFRDVPRAAKNIYEQQVQMALFLREHYSGQAIAANDIGAMNFFADLQLLDTHGMGTLAVFDAKRKQTYGPAVLDQLARQRGVQIAVIYPEWLERKWGGVPPGWHKVGTWTIPGNIICAHDTVVFYAVQDAERERLRNRLQAFAAKLPRGVVWQLY
jgi:hypothetical protein